MASSRDASHRSSGGKISAIQDMPPKGVVLVFKFMIMRSRPPIFMVPVRLS